MLPGAGGGAEMAKGHEETFWNIKNITYLVCGGDDLIKYTFIKIHWSVHLKGKISMCIKYTSVSLIKLLPPPKRK